MTDKPDSSPSIAVTVLGAYDLLALETVALMTLATILERRAAWKTPSRSYPRR